MFNVEITHDGIFSQALSLRAGAAAASDPNAGLAKVMGHAIDGRFGKGFRTVDVHLYEPPGYEVRALVIESRQTGVRHKLVATRRISTERDRFYVRMAQATVVVWVHYEAESPQAAAWAFVMERPDLFEKKDTVDLVVSGLRRGGDGFVEVESRHVISRDAALAERARQERDLVNGAIPGI